jgi:mRNA interferase MazF
MRRSEIFLATLDPVRGSEANKARPVVIVSHDALNRVVAATGRGVVTAVPLSSNVERVHTFQVFLPAEVTGLDRDSKAQAEQVRALAFERFAPEPIGLLPSDYLAALETALRIHLALPGWRA